MAEAIKVAVRVRPINQREKDKKCSMVVSMRDKTTTVQFGKNPKHFTYDYCYNSMDPADKDSATQANIFLDIGQAILSNAMNGFNGTLFTYGQTGSGKSYSVMGPPEEPGIIPRLVINLFNWTKPESQNADRQLEIYISYLEIYKEQVTDLLAPTTKEPEVLKIMDHPKLGVYVRGLQEVPCEKTEVVMRNLQYGIKKRVTAATSMNATSSRSHAVFTLRVNILDGPRPKPNEKDDRKCLSAKVNLIDLAGSERQSKAQTSGAQQKEGSSINQSLSALGMCIKSLADSKPDKDLVVPFRMSKLTFLLKDSLAGNSKTFMMAAISPANDNVEETLSTLRFASSVKTIQTVAVQNKDKKDELIDKMEEEIRALKAQVRAGGTPEGVELLLETERLKEDLKKNQNFAEQIKIAQKMNDVRYAALQENGLSQAHITQAFGISEGTPYLLNMADDPMLAGCLIYLIKESELTSIGKHKDNTITINGVGIPDFLCHIQNEGNVKATLQNISEAGRVVVNGKLIDPGDPPWELHNGDRIFLGRAQGLKMIMPEDTESKGASGMEDLSLEGLQEEYAALDDSPSWANITGYLDLVLHGMEKKSASVMFEQMKKACAFCDEANELTRECRPNLALQFEVDLTASMPACVVIRVLCTEDPSGRLCTDEEAWETKYLWTVDNLVERVYRMRDYGTFFKEKGYREQDIDPMEDPWQENAQDEVFARIRSMEADLEEARTHLLHDHVKRLRKMMAVQSIGGENSAKILQFFFRVWRVNVEEKQGDTQALMRALRKRASTGSEPTLGSTARERGSSDMRNAVSEPADRRGNTAAPKRRMTLSRKRTSSVDAAKSPEKVQEDAAAESSASAKAKPTLKKQMTVSMRDSISEISAETPRSSLTSQVISEAAGRSRTTSQATDSSQATSMKDESDPLLMETAAENNGLRRQLDESLEQGESLKKQLEVAWELCGILRDYACQLEQNPNAADAAAAALCSAFVPSSPSRGSCPTSDFASSPSRPRLRGPGSPPHSPPPALVRVAMYPGGSSSPSPTPLPPPMAVVPGPLMEVTSSLSRSPLRPGAPAMPLAAQVSLPRCCPVGHPLDFFTSPSAGQCDTCNVSIPTGSLLYGCRPCNFDECGSCVSEATGCALTMPKPIALAASGSPMKPQYMPSVAAMRQLASPMPSRPLPVSGGFESSGPAVSSQRSTSADRRSPGAAAAAGMTTLPTLWNRIDSATMRPGVLPDLWAARGTGPAAPQRSASAERTPSRTQIQPVRLISANTSIETSLPSDKLSLSGSAQAPGSVPQVMSWEASAVLPLSEQDRERGRLSMLEEQVRLIAQRVGKPLPAPVHENHGSTEAPN